MMNKRDCTKELNRIKAHIRDRKKWRDARVTKAKKETDENKKKYQQLKKERAREAERAEHERIKTDAQKKADSTIRAAASQLAAEEQETATGEAEDPDDLGVEPLPADDDEQEGEQASQLPEREVSPEVISRKRTKSRSEHIEDPEGITSPARGRGGRGRRAFDAENVQGNILNIMRTLQRIENCYNALERTLDNRNDVSANAFCIYVCIYVKKVMVMVIKYPVNCRRTSDTTARMPTQSKRSEKG